MDLPSHHAPIDDVETWHARDGEPVVIRLIGPDDDALEKAFTDGLSRETSYRRLLSPRKLLPEEITRFTHIDLARERAWVAVTPGPDAVAICGVVRYFQDGDVAEWAIVLADAWQGRGLGTKLLAKLIDSARAAGVAVLSDITFATNAPMIGLARKLGFTIAREPADATLTRMTLVL